MQQLTTLRPLVAAGAMAIGASIIALMPAVSNDLAADVHRGAFTVQQRAVELTDSVVSPIGTWLDTLATTTTNVQTLADIWGQTPFVVAQQVATNWVQFASDYVGAYQGAANGAVNFFLGTCAGCFVPNMSQAWADIAAGNILAAFGPAPYAPLYKALLLGPSISVLEPLENIPSILAYIGTDLANGLTYMFNDGIESGLDILGGNFVVSAGEALLYGIGSGAQAVYDAAGTGGPLDLLLNLANMPAVVTNFFLNGYPSPPNVGLIYGLLTVMPTTIGYPSAPGHTTAPGSFYEVLTTLLPTLAKSMAAPDAQNIAEGGSLSVAIQDFFNQLVTGWPSLSTILNDVSTLWSTYFGGSGLTGAAAVVNGGIAASVAAGLPGLSADLLKAFDPAAVTNIAASLGPSLAADVAGSLGSSLGANIASSLATTLSVELPSLALHILSAL